MSTAPTGPYPLFDVVIVGAGVVGAASARALVERFPTMTVALVETAPGPFAGASRGNSAFLHSGFDTTPGTVESFHVRRGHRYFSRWLEAYKEGEVPYQRCGALMLASSDADVAGLKAVRQTAIENGVETRWLEAREAIVRVEPALAKAPATLRAALHIPSEWTVDPYVVPAMWLNEASQTQRCTTMFSQRVLRIDRVSPDGHRFKIRLASGRYIGSRMVVNAAGLRAGVIDDMRPWAGPTGQRLHLHPRLGRFVGLTANARAAAGYRGCALLPLPTPKTKGVIVFAGSNGAMVVGPTAEDPSEVNPDHRLVSGNLVATAMARVPALEEYVRTKCDGDVTKVIAFSYSGKRPTLKDQRDYFLDAEQESWITVAGVRSTGLTSALSLGKFVAVEVGKALPGFTRAAKGLTLPKTDQKAAVAAFPRITHPLSAAAGGVGGGAKL